MLIGPFIIGGIFMLISWIVSNRLKNKFKEYSQIHLTKDLTGAEIARLMLADNGINDVKVISVEGQLTDHYNPVDKTVNLSQEVFYGRNAAATAVAAHECGHAVQHAKAYSMLQFRSAMVPVQNISGTVVNFVSMALLFGGAFLHNFWPTAILLIVVCNLVFTLFALVTLPVEFDASKRAMAWLDKNGIVHKEEYGMARNELNWAATTTVVAAISSLATLLYYIWIYMGRRD